MMTGTRAWYELAVGPGKIGIDRNASYKGPTLYPGFIPLVSQVTLPSVCPCTFRHAGSRPHIQPLVMGPRLGANLGTPGTDVELVKDLAFYGHCTTLVIELVYRG